MALVLTRKPGEAIVAGGPAVIRVVRILAGKVQLAIEADRGVCVDREEIHLAKTGRPSKRADADEQRGLRADALEGSAA